MTDSIDAAQENDAIFQRSSLSDAIRARKSNEAPLVIKGVRHCLDCENRIPKARLKAKPDALRCIDCQTKKEKR